MDYKRLTRRNQDGTTWVKCAVCDIQDKCDFTKESCCQELHNRLAELEDKIEQGTLIELQDRKPLMWGKDGDTIHCQHCGKDLMGVFDGETEVIQCPKCGGFVYGLFAEDYNEAILKELQE